MARAELQRLAVAHHRLGRPGAHRPGEALALGLVAEQCRDAGHLLGGVEVHVAKDPERVGGRLGLGRVRGVALLPEELGRAEEQTGPHLPADHVGPLVDEQGQVAVALDPLREEVVDHGLAGRPDHDRLLEQLAAPVGHHGQLGAEPLHVGRLEPEERFGDEQREVGALGAGLLDAPVHLVDQQLPDAEAPRADDHGAADRPVLGHLGAGHHLLVPTGEVLGSGGERPLVVRHAEGYPWPGRLPGVGRVGRPVSPPRPAGGSSRSARWTRSGRRRPLRATPFDRPRPRRRPSCRRRPGGPRRPR